MPPEAPNPEAPDLVWYFDVISPFAYLALPAIEALAQHREILLRPIVLGAVLAHWGQKGPAEIEPKRLHTYRLCQFLADQGGLPFRFPPRHPFRSLETLRLLAALGPKLETVRAAFEFVWAEGRDPSAPGELDSLHNRLRPGNPDDALIGSDGAKDQLRRWTNTAITAGIFGVPTLAIGDALFWGIDAMPMAAAYLANPALLTSNEMARIVALLSASPARPRRPQIPVKTLRQKM